MESGPGGAGCGCFLAPLKGTEPLPRMRRFRVLFLPALMPQVVVTSPEAKQAESSANGPPDRRNRSGDARRRSVLLPAASPTMTTPTVAAPRIRRTPPTQCRAVRFRLLYTSSTWSNTYRALQRVLGPTQECWGSCSSRSVTMLKRLSPSDGLENHRTTTKTGRVLEPLKLGRIGSRWASAPGFDTRDGGAQCCSDAARS